MVLHNRNRRNIAKITLFSHNYSDVETKNDGMKKKDYIPFSLMNIDTTIDNKILEVRTKNTSKNYAPWPFWIHPTVAEVVQHTKICQCFRPYKEKEKKTILSLSSVKAFVKIQYSFMIKVLKMRMLPFTCLNTINKISSK